LGWPDLGTIFLLVGGRRWIPDLMSAEPVHRVSNAACGGIGDVGTPTDMPLWSLF
jgi:hypothetical protein